MSSWTPSEYFDLTKGMKILAYTGFYCEQANLFKGFISERKLHEDFRHGQHLTSIILYLNIYAEMLTLWQTIEDYYLKTVKAREK